MKKTQAAIAALYSRSRARKARLFARHGKDSPQYLAARALHDRLHFIATVSDGFMPGAYHNMRQDCRVVAAARLITENRALERRAYAQGRAAALAAIDTTACPWRPNSAPGRAWFKGYQEGTTERRDHGAR